MSTRMLIPPMPVIEPQNTQAAWKARRRRTYNWIGLGLFLFFLLALFGTQIFLHQTSVGSERFVANTVLLMGLTALVVVIVLVLGFVLARNVVKVYFDRRSDLLGSRFKIRLLVAFGALSLAPTVLQMFLALSLISRSIDQWFSAPAHQMMDNSGVLSESYYQEISERAASLGRFLAPDLLPALDPEYRSDADPGHIKRLLAARMPSFPEARVRICDRQGNVVEVSADFQSKTEAIRTALLQALAGQEYVNTDTDARLSDLLICGVPVRRADGAVLGAVLVERFIPRSVAFKMASVREAVERYTALEGRKFEYYWTYLLVLLLATAMILFGFSWFALYVAKRITVPIQALAEGAEQVAAGRLDYRVHCETSDEVKNLVDSFNRMIEELEQNRRQIDSTYRELQRANVESEDRRRYIETLLENIPSCVISTDNELRITTVNRAASEVLNIKKEAAVGRVIQEAMNPELATNLIALAKRAEFSGQAVREIEWSDGERSLHLAASLNLLQDAQGRTTAAIILLDDLTELINAEKLAAWQEVARRLAHEIRNPLTPIQLSAERIRRQAGLEPQRAAAEAIPTDAGAENRPLSPAVIDESTRLIIEEARSLKRLVEEFSRFARMPAHRPVPAEINKVIESALMLYSGRLKSVEIALHLGKELPLLMLDTEQMKRVFVNLVDNALAAMAEPSGERRITISSEYHKRQARVHVEVADTGCGISRADRENLFLPYFSRRKKGTGLGLAIVRQIINEHDGRIRAEDNLPCGARMVIDLPVAALPSGSSGLPVGMVSSHQDSEP